jgi:hypothetical protein
MQPGLIAAVFGLVSLLGPFALVPARGRPWTVPVWMFLAVPCLGCFAWSLGLLAAYFLSPPRQHVPVGGSLEGLEALLAVSGFVVFDLIAVMVAVLAPPPSAWTGRSAVGGLVAATVSAGWCLIVGSLHPASLTWAPSGALTVTVPDGFEGRAWIFEDPATGVPPRWLLGNASYTVPDNGVLVTSDAGPMGGSKFGSDFRGVTVRTAGGVTMIPGHWADRTASPPSYRSTRHTEYIELMFGNVAPLRESLVRLRDDMLSDCDYDWWPNNPAVMFRPAESRVNGTDVSWRTVDGESIGHAFETRWSALEDPARCLQLRFSVARPPQLRIGRATVRVLNVGTEVVDGWDLQFSAHFVFTRENRHPSYTEAICQEKRVPFVPLMPQPVARHTFFRLPGTRPLHPGEQDEIQIDLKRGLINVRPTLDWAKSLTTIATDNE